MKLAFRYLLARLDEPGTMRSLIWVCLSMAGLDAGDTAVTNTALVASLVLGVWSALRVEQKPMVVSVSTEHTATAVGVAVQTQDKPS